MQHVAHQTICMQYILELAKQLDYDPRACVDAFFSKIQVAEVEYKQSFEDELNQFKERIRKRAAEKIEEAMKVNSMKGSVNFRLCNSNFLGSRGRRKAKTSWSRWPRSSRSDGKSPRGPQEVFRVPRHQTASGNYSQNGQRGSDVSHEALRRLRALGAGRGQRQGRGVGWCPPIKGRSRFLILLY